MDVIRIEIKGDAKEVTAVIDQLEKVGKVDKKNADQFKKHHEEQKKHHHEQIDFNTKLTHSFKELGEGIVAAFAVEKIIEFGEECLKEFGEAEKATNDLRFAVKNLAGGDDSAFNELKEQSEQLSNSLNNLFSPKQIQQSQTMLLRMKLNTEQVAALMPRIADIAAKTGKDLNSVAEGFGRAISEGNTKALTEFGLKFKDTGTVVGNFNKVMESSVKYIGGAADAMNDFANQQKEAANKAEILQEEIGSKLAPVWIGLKNEILGGTSSLIHFFEELKNGLTGKNFNWKEASKDLANALGYLFTAGLVHFKTTAEQMEEYQKMSYNMLLKNYVDLKGELNKAVKEGDAEEILEINEKLRVISQLVLAHNKKEVIEQDSVDKQLRDHKEKAQAMSIAQLKSYQKQVLEHESNFSVTGFEQEKSAIEAAIKFQEESGKKKSEERKRQLEKEAKELEEWTNKVIAEMIKDDQERTSLEIETNDLHLKRVEQTMEAELESQKFGLKKKLIAGKISKEEFDRQTKDLDLKSQVERDRLELDQIKENQDIKRTELDRERKMNIISEEQYQKELLKLEVDYADKQLQLQKDINKLTDSLKDDQKEKLKKMLEGIKEISETLLDSLTESINSSVEAIDTQMSRNEKIIETQKLLAEKGLRNDLAFEERRQDELTKKKLEEQKKLKKVKEIEVFLNSLVKFSEENPHTALAKALGVLASTKIAETIFAEDGALLGQSKGLGAFSRRHKSGKDILVHAEEGEMVVPTWKTAEMGINTQERFKNFLKTPFNEKLYVPVKQRHSNADVVAELQDLKQVIFNKRETSVDWEGLDMRIATIENGMKTSTTYKRKGI